MPTLDYTQVVLQKNGSVTPNRSQAGNAQFNIGNLTVEDLLNANPHNNNPARNWSSLGTDVNNTVGADVGNAIISPFTNLVNDNKVDIIVGIVGVVLVVLALAQIAKPI